MKLKIRTAMFVVAMTAASITSGYELSGGTIETFDNTTTNMGTESIAVGNQNDDNTLQFINGSQVQSGYASVGAGFAGYSDYRPSSGWGGGTTYSAPSVTANNNTLLIRGAGSQWSSSGSIGVGTTFGNSNAMVISEGALVSSAGGNVGTGRSGYYRRSSSGSTDRDYSTSSAANSVSVTGVGSRWDNSGSINVGVTYGNGNSILVSNGGTLSSAGGSIGRGYAGSYSSGSSSSTYYSRSSTNNSVTISGTGSRWDNAGSFALGIMNGNSNTLRIEHGGVVTNMAATIGQGRAYSSYSWGSSSAGYGNDNKVVVDGEGSSWNNSGNILLGNNNGNRNSISISNGGTVTADSMEIGKGSWSSSIARADNNRVEVSGSGSRLDVSGTVTIGNSYATGNQLSVSNGGAVTAETISIASGNSLVLDQGGTLSLSGDFDSNQPGSLSFNGGVLSVEGMVSGFTTLNANTRLETANLNGHFTVHGTFAPGNSPADSIVNGSLTIASDGTLEMELGGYGLGTEYDRLTVTGLGELDGTLDVVFLDGFAPTNGASFDLFNWDGGVNGTFSDINSSTLPEGLSWDTSNLYTNGTVTVIPEPSVLALVGIFGSGLWVVRRYFPRV